MHFYNQISKGYNELYMDEQSKKLSIIKENIKITKEDMLLDVGCGTGISSQFNCIVVGLDPSIELLKQNETMNKVMGLAEILPFRSNSFDFVYAVTSIHNFDDIRKALLEIKRVGNKNFAFSVLKRSKKFGYIRKTIEKYFTITKEIDEEKDTIFICETL